MAGRLGIVKPNNHVVAVQRIHDDFCVKIFSVDARGAGIKRVGNLGECRRRAGVGGFTKSRWCTHERGVQSLTCVTYGCICV
jgi:hypothetical protein